MYHTHLNYELEVSELHFISHFLEFTVHISTLYKLIRLLYNITPWSSEWVDEL